MSERLDPGGAAVYVGNVVLNTPGLTGVAEVHPTGAPQMRAAEATTSQFLSALDNTGFTEQFTVEIAEQAELDARGGTRAAGGGSEIVANVPGPGDGFGQVLLFTAEDGSVTWHLPDDVVPGEVPTRGGDRRTYRIPRAVMPAGQPGEQRGALGMVGKKLLKVLVFPLLDPVIGAVGEHYAARWEKKNRRDRVRSFEPDTYRDANAGPLTDRDWRQLAQGPALLFVHGTMSQSHTGFHRIPGELMKELNYRYHGRVFAFDHRTVTVTPTDNAKWFATQVPPGLDAVVDVVAHSRGGLVSRALAERAGEVGLGDKLTVRKLVMVGTPNAGTALADVGHLKQLLDRVTGLVQFFPDNGVTDTLDIVLTIIKQLAAGAFQGLDGLMSMNPAGTYLPAFNDTPGSSAVYKAVASNYEPVDGSPLTRVARDGVADIVFSTRDNDLIVPTEGVYDIPGARGFPIADPLLFGGAEGVDHSGYWDQPRFASSILDWLTG